MGAREKCKGILMIFDKKFVKLENCFVKVF